MDLISRVQGYLRYRARERHDVVAMPPFSLFLHPVSAAVEDNLAMPDSAAAGETPSACARLRAAFAGQRRIPRVSFLAEFAPRLAPALRRAGFAETERLPVMVCTPRFYRLPSDLPELVVVTLSPASSLEEVMEHLEINSQGFDRVPVPVTPGTAKEFRLALSSGRAFTARLHGQPVGAAVYREIHAEVSELVGITTLPAYRRRGIATALTAYATCSAFAAGAEVAFLIAAHQAAGRVYAHVGFYPCATLLEYVDRCASGY